MKSPKTDPRTDRELVAASLADASAFALIVERYQEPLRRYVRRLGCRDGNNCEDVLQDTFINVYLNLNGFDQSLKFSSWIYRIAHNQTMDFFRRSKTKPQPAMTDAEVLMLEEVSDRRDLAGDTDRRLTAGVLRAALEGLDDKYREVLTLKYLEEKSYEEISDILRKPMGTVATLINRAKARLKAELASHPLAAEIWKAVDSPTI